MCEGVKHTVSSIYIVIAVQVKVVVCVGRFPVKVVNSELSGPGETKVSKNWYGSSAVGNLCSELYVTVNGVDVLWKLSAVFCLPGVKPIPKP